MHNIRDDHVVDATRIHLRIQMFEKHVSGMFLGKVLRVLLVFIAEACLFFGKSSDPLKTQYGVDTMMMMSTIAADTTSPTLTTSAKQSPLCSESLNLPLMIEKLSNWFRLLSRGDLAVLLAFLVVSNHTGCFESAIEA